MIEIQGGRLSFVGPLTLGRKTTPIIRLHVRLFCSVLPIRSREMRVERQPDPEVNNQRQANSRVMTTS
jgi:hypothetical protein